jgi:hypothetical protein
MIRSSRRDRKAKATAEVLAMIDDAHSELAPPHPVRETDEGLSESATEFCAALDRFAEHALHERINNRIWRGESLATLRLVNKGGRTCRRRKTGAYRPSLLFLAFYGAGLGGPLVTSRPGAFVIPLERS